MKRIAIIIFGIMIIGSLQAQTKSKASRSAKQSRITTEINLDEADVQDFKERTGQKIDEFEQHVITIADKAEPQERRDMAEREALGLFYAGAMMEVTNLGVDGDEDIKTRPMEKYLYRLKTLPYTRVEIKYYDIAYVREFVKGPDGRYYSTATIIQEFTGFIGDDIKYTDITKKEIEIVVEQVEDKFYNEKRWKVFLGDIKATETRANLGML